MLDDDTLEFVLEIEELSVSLGCAIVEDATVLETKSEVNADLAAGVEEGDWESDTTGEDLTTEEEEEIEDTVDEPEEEEENKSERTDELAASVGEAVELDDGALEDNVREVGVGVGELDTSLGCAEVDDASVLDTASEVDVGLGAGVEEIVCVSDTTDEDLTTEREDARLEEDEVGEVEEEEEEVEERLALLESCEVLEDEETGVEEACSDDTDGSFPAWPESAIG